MSPVTPYVTPTCIIPSVRSQDHYAFTPLGVYFKHEDEARGPVFANQFSELMLSGSRAQEGP